MSGSLFDDTGTSIHDSSQSVVHPPPLIDPNIVVADDFDFAAAMRRSIRIEAAFNEDSEDLLLDLSPLTSPESSRPGSPIPSVLWDLSDLTSPESSPPNSPTHVTINFPVLPPHPTSGHTLPTPPVLPPPPMPAAATLASAPPTQTLSALERRKAKINAARHVCRDQALAAAKASRYIAKAVKPKMVNRHVNNSEAIVVDFDFAEAENVTSNAYTGLDDGSRSKRVYTLEELCGKDSKFRFKLRRWDGKTRMAIVDKKGRLIGILAGRPEDSSWPLLHVDACRRMEMLRSRCTKLKGKKKIHRRGPFVALRFGTSHGGGQTAPTNLGNTTANAEVIHELQKHRLFRRIAGFASDVMATWAPKLHQYYVDRLGKLHAHHAHLKRSFSNSVFSATSFNLGPRTVCFKHTDFGNLPFGLCAVTALGEFDPCAGGHLVLWECGLVIEFPPGSTILLASGVVAHSNTAIAKTEHRYSVAQYSSGALFRWVDNNFEKAVDYKKKLSDQELEEAEARDEARWAFGLSLLPVFTM